MQAQNHFGARRAFNAQALWADRNAAIGAGFYSGANTPNIRPPRAARGWAEDGAFFFFGQFPSHLGYHAQLAVDFMGVAMETQIVDVGVGLIEICNLFAGEIGREAALPELMLALDFSFCLGRWGIKEADVVELERRAELGEGLGILGEENGVIIDIDLKRASVGQEALMEETSDEAMRPIARARRSGNAANDAPGHAGVWLGWNGRSHSPSPSASPGRGRA
jgi:hypothetical protein